MWNALEDSFARKSISALNLLRKQLSRMKLREGESMRAHLLAFEDLLRQLRTAGARIEEADAVVSFSGTRVRATRVLERIHSDVCGPIDPPAWDGSRYFVSFIDNFSHFAIIYLMKRKSDVYEKLKEYEATTTAMFQTRISKMTIDQGREYMSNKLKFFYSQKGIQVEQTVAYTPQQNGVAERFNRTVIEKVRSMMIAAKVPRYLWSEATLTAVYLTNRSPTTAVPRDTTPAEMWYNQKPSFKKLRVFGCKAFAWIAKQNRTKLDPRSFETVMVGYAPNGYRLWDKRTKRIRISRDVKFDESCYPFSNDSEPTVSPVRIVFDHEQERECDESAVVDKDPLLTGPVVDNDTLLIGNPMVTNVPLVDEASEDVPCDEEEAPNRPETGALPSHIERLDPVNQPMSRHSERERRLPGKLFDYFIGYSAISAGSQLSTDLPTCYDDIGQRPDREAWLRAIQDELDSMRANRVWDLVPCPTAIRPLKSKWLFRIKQDEHGQDVKHKARLVVKGYLQRAGIDYEDTYAPVARLSTIRTVLAVAVQYQFHVHQMDVKTAFLHGDIVEDIYMEVPQGVKTKPNAVCKLRKSLYGLKQSPRCWNDRFNNQMLKMDFRRSKHDSCLYTRCTEGDEMYAILYVDDLLLMARKIETLVIFKRQLSEAFSMTDCGEVHHFLGIKLVYDRNHGTLRLSMEAHVDKILDRFGMSECNPVKTPMEKGLQLQRKGLPTKEPYRELLGSIMYTMLCIRPDICYPVGYLGRFQQVPCEEHWSCLKRLTRFLKGTTKTSLLFRRNENAQPLVGFADADWASDVEDRKSVSGFIFKVFDSTVSWSSKKQATVALSSSESEYIALSSAASEAIWLAGLLADLEVKELKLPVTIYEDNKGCIGMAKNLDTKRTKHIDIRHHFLRDHVANGTLKIESTTTHDQVADLLTKALDLTRFQFLSRRLGLTD